MTIFNLLSLFVLIFSVTNFFHIIMQVQPALSWFAMQESNELGV